MKMSSMFVGLLVLCFVTGQATAQIELAFTVVDTVISWSSTFYSTQADLTDKTPENVEKILATVNEISTELGNFESRTDTKLDAMLNTLLNDIEITTELQTQKAQLLHHLHDVDHFYDDSLKYTIDKSYATVTLTKFTERVLYDSSNLPKILVEMHDIFSPGAHVHLSSGFLSLVIQKTTQNLPTDCQRYISPQQLMFYIYVQLLTAEVKSLVTFKNAYTIKWWLDETSHNYTSELNDARMNFVTRVRKYSELFTQEFSRLPRHLRRCHVNEPKRGVDFFELEKFSRIKVLDSYLGSIYDCETCDRQIKKQAYLHRTNANINNCVKLTTSATVCPANSDSIRDFLWWKDDEGTYYGANTECPVKTEFRRAKSHSYKLLILFCSFCMCSVVENETRDNSYKAWHVDLNPQFSDYRNNIVVTGVQFIVKDRTIYLQIQQANFALSGMIHENVTWKGTDADNTYRLPILPPARISPNLKTLYLDDIIVDDNSVVTGVKFMHNPQGKYLELIVHATKFDFATGKPDASSSLWVSSSRMTNGITERDYSRKRIEIQMDEADDPIKGAGFPYDPETNKMITFTHTDSKKDGGQTTIPFFDMQPVHAKPLFPLSGIGLYYRGRKGFGGYIAPRIFTYDVSKSMKKPSNI